MSETKWKATPGPWRFYSGSRSVYSSDDRTSIAVVSGPYKLHDDRVLANGNLITAAPDLFTALEAVARDVCGALCPSTWKTSEGRPPCHPKCQAIKAALSKARGDG